MFTFRYKGWYIHGHFDREEVRVQSPDRQVFTAKSIHAAKCVITRRIGRGAAGE